MGAIDMNELIGHLLKLPAPLAVLIPVGACAAALDFRAARRERLRRTRLPAQSSREISS